MKIRRVKWASHPILGNLELNFINEETKLPYETIIIAGENGTGKTTILETIYDFLNRGLITPFEFIEYGVDSEVLQAVPCDSSMDSFFDIKNLETGKIHPIRCNRNISSQRIKENHLDPRHYYSAYTKARANYEPKKISTISTKTIDSDDYERGESNASDLKQLLVDVQTQDNNDFASRAQGDPEQEISWVVFEPDSKMHRFSSAFNKFFENKLEYFKTNLVNGVHEVLFKKNDKEISIDQLSTGESQIVFRGAYLLKNIGNMNESVVFIDEPEISMHPRWQQKILSYYKGIFSDNNRQKAQIIVATHSEGVLAEALKDENTKVIVLKLNDDGSICPGDIKIPLVLKGSSAEINYQAFGTALTDYHNALYGFIAAERLEEEYAKGKEKVLYKYKRVNSNGVKDKKICLSKKIRHMIHHPENRENDPYTEEEVIQSIEDMRDFILKHVDHNS